MLPRRVLIKLSGESLASINHPTDQAAMGFDPAMLIKLADDVLSVYTSGIDVAMVVGGGNFFRGLKGVGEHGLERTVADHMGMLATVLNGLALGHTIHARGDVDCRVMSAIPMPTVCEPYIRQKADRHLAKRRIVICVAGTGNPYFTTDSAAVLRASEMNCDLLIKGTKVKGVFDRDPHKFTDAEFLPHINYTRALTDHLGVMDSSAMALARDHHLPILVCSLYEPDSILQAINNTVQHSRIGP